MRSLKNTFVSYRVDTSIHFQHLIVKVTRASEIVRSHFLMLLLFFPLPCMYRSSLFAVPSHVFSVSFSYDLRSCLSEIVMLNCCFDVELLRTSLYHAFSL